MNILVMGFTKLKYMPYMNFYLDNIDITKNNVDILYWNRDLQEEDASKFSECNLIEFKCYQEDDKSKTSKINSFVKYRKFAKRVLNTKEYDLIFVLHSLTGVLVCDVLQKKYKDKYIFDYRDSTYESFTPFKKIVAKLVYGSKATFVSSDAFRQLLPEDCKEKIYTSHNILLDSLNHRDDKAIYGTSSDAIRIAFWGFIRHEDINKEIIKKIANDSRFELHYYGREQQVAINLKNYAKEIEAKNVFFHGEYTPEDRYKFILETDLIHNIYYDANTMLAMGNKFYDGVIFEIPQLCMKESYMGECVTKANVGIECDPYNDNFSDKIYDYYRYLNKEVFHLDASSIANKLVKEYNYGCNYIQNITKKEEK